MVLMGISIIYCLSFQAFTSNESRNILIILPFFLSSEERQMNKNQTKQ